MTYPTFKSDLTRGILGRGITNRKMVSRDEAKLYLNTIASLADVQMWIKLCVIDFLSPGNGWDIGTVSNRLADIQHDIIQMQLRLEETAITLHTQEKPVAAPNQEEI